MGTCREIGERGHGLLNGSILSMEALNAMGVQRYDDLWAVPNGQAYSLAMQKADEARRAAAQAAAAAASDTPAALVCSL